MWFFVDIFGRVFAYISSCSCINISYMFQHRPINNHILDCNSFCVRCKNMQICHADALGPSIYHWFQYKFKLCVRYLFVNIENICLCFGFESNLIFVIFSKFWKILQPLTFLFFVCKSFRFKILFCWVFVTNKIYNWFYKIRREHLNPTGHTI